MRLAKPGQDQMTMRVHWISNTGKLQSATVRYDINVVDHPL